MSDWEIATSWHHLGWDDDDLRPVMAAWEEVEAFTVLCCAVMHPTKRHLGCNRPHGHPGDHCSWKRIGVLNVRWPRSIKDALRELIQLEEDLS